jgi:hypothetical protein
MKKSEPIFLIANGDLRLAANLKCEPEQAAMEKKLTSAFAAEGFTLQRAHAYDWDKQHGFIDSQKMGLEVFRTIPEDAPLVVAESVWQYSQHILPGLYDHKGPILTVANWSGTWPGLVGLLNLNACLTKAGVKYSSLWSENFTDEFFLDGLRHWLKKGKIKHNTGHVCTYKKFKVPGSLEKLGRRFAQELKKHKYLMGVFDESCMGMANAVIPDELLARAGLFKERLSQSTLYARMLTVKDEDARAVYQWLLDKGLTFRFGPSEENDLTENQVLQQCKMYIAAVRIADEFGCSTIGIQYQQGLKDLCPASDLAEGLLNNVERPPVFHETTRRELFRGEALPHFNEVDECAGLDGLVTYKLWRLLGFPPENTLHDVRWGRPYRDDTLNAFVWVFQISGAVPPAHLNGGYSGAVSERQPAMYFRLGGGTIKGVCKPGWIVWSRVYVDDGKLKYDTGLGQSVALPEKETQDRWEQTTPQWPILHAVLPGISRDQMMARHKSNHIQVAYAPNRESAVKGLLAKAAAMHELGLEVSLCGRV